MKSIKPPHGFDISFTPEAREQFNALCDDPEQARRIMSLLARLSVSGHIDGEEIDDTESSKLRLFSERGDRDWLSVVYSAQTEIRVCSIRRWPFED